MSKAIKPKIYSRVQDSSLYLVSGTFFAARAFLDVATVVPGQPIPIVWSLHTLPGVGLGPGKVTAHVYLDKFNSLLFDSKPVPLQAVLFGLDTTEQKALIPPPPNGGVANELYHIGLKTLRLEVVFDKTGEMFSTTAELQVIPDHFGGWGWSGAQGTNNPSAIVLPPMPFFPRFNFLINHSYKLSGRMDNTAGNPNVTITGSLTIQESQSGTSDTTEVETVAFSVGPGGHLDVLSIPIVKNWTWLVSGVWVRNFSEPLSKTFGYSVRYSFTDSYGNSYPEVLSPLTLTVNVGVSDEKRGYGDGALGVLGVGIIAAIFTFGAGLSAAQAIAGGLGSKALDPPVPDSRYGRRVVVGEPPYNQVVVPEPFVEVMGVVFAAGRAIALVDALGDIENRLLGAQIVKDRNAIRLQLESYRETEAALYSVAEGIVDLGANAVKALQARPEFDRDSIEATLRAWQRHGISAEVLDRLYAGGVTDINIAKLTLALAEPGVIEAAQDPTQALSLLTYSIVLAARELRRRSESVVAGAELSLSSALRRSS